MSKHRFVTEMSATVNVEVNLFCVGKRVDTDVARLNNGNASNAGQLLASTKYLGIHHFFLAFDAWLSNEVHLRYFYGLQQKIFYEVRVFRVFAAKGINH